MRIAFYRGSGNVITYVIRLLTWGPYSHVVLQFNDGWVFGSTGQKPTTGVHWVCEDLSVDWDVFEMPFTAAQQAGLEQYVERFEGNAFDWAGMWGFVFPWVKDGHPNKWYCSDLVLMLLQNCLGVFVNKPRKISPNALYRLWQRSYPSKAVVGVYAPGPCP